MRTFVGTERPIKDAHVTLEGHTLTFGALTAYPPHVHTDHLAFDTSAGWIVIYNEGDERVSTWGGYPLTETTPSLTEATQGQ